MAAYNKHGLTGLDDVLSSAGFPLGFDVDCGGERARAPALTKQLTIKEWLARPVFLPLHLQTRGAGTSTGQAPPRLFVTWHPAAEIKAEVDLLQDSDACYADSTHQGPAAPIVSSEGALDPWFAVEVTHVVNQALRCNGRKEVWAIRPSRDQRIDNVANTAAVPVNLTEPVSSQHPDHDLISVVKDDGSYVDFMPIEEKRPDVLNEFRQYANFLERNGLPNTTLGELMNLCIVDQQRISERTTGGGDAQQATKDRTCLANCYHALCQHQREPCDVPGLFPGGCFDVEELHFCAHLGTSAARTVGTVYLGRLGETDVAIKLVTADDSAALRFWLNELEAYSPVERLQGDMVPKLVAHGTTCKGEAAFLALELINGRTVDPYWMDVPQAERLVAITAELHARGVCHDDLENNNVMMEDPSGRMVVLDSFHSLVDAAAFKFNEERARVLTWLYKAEDRSRVPPQRDA
ncbi:hypothetical protein WJX72_011331 [[Myrmecia] bisecta]|uniref:Protein kinase domain-containing protein n=1 Tax=[Myrmecia] bisecta TaxID=41462 RepID=A0AAW1P564_9CHLO